MKFNEDVKVSIEAQHILEEAKDGMIEPASDENGKNGERSRSRFITRDREAGNRIEGFSTLDEAKAAINAYEEEDRQQGTYEPDFYEVAELRGDYYETVE